MGRAHPLLRLALFVAVTFGVFGMHTFGHPAGTDAAHASAVREHRPRRRRRPRDRRARRRPRRRRPARAPRRDARVHRVPGGAGRRARPRRPVPAVAAPPRHRHAGRPSVTRAPPDRGPPRRPIGLLLRAVTVLRT
ncbi:hypothetical protein V2I01_29875 [Micromonospora sp. BRA006-A]|nr:hypothetical protein [Micromonospora sp. BRA006-A]